MCVHVYVSKCVCVRGRMRERNVGKIFCYILHQQLRKVFREYTDLCTLSVFMILFCTLLCSVF